jgi:hypothetical protein
LISIRQISHIGDNDAAEDEEKDVSKALGTKDSKTFLYASANSKLSRIYQLTG